MAVPKITVVTPSFNQGRFIEQTINSVISQQYPNLEYIIMDGGSTDNTVEILKKYEKYISYWQSQKDNGQAAAINEGFTRATGDILCWINSDDMYMPGVFDKVAGYFNNPEQRRILFGNCQHFHDDKSKTRGSDVVKNSARYDLSLCDYVIQPSSFWNRKVWELTGPLNEELHFTFDWDWFIRAEKKGVEFMPVQDYLSRYRIHDAHKSGSGGGRRVEELKRIVALYNNEKLAKAFSKWMDIYVKKNFISQSIDNAQRFGFGFLNQIFRRFFFSSLTSREYENIIAMK